MASFNPKDKNIKQISNFLTSAIIPRPIAFVSTIDKDGNPNLSPFSFFNVFSSVPPILIFSPAKSALTGNQKDTYHNVKEVPECVIHIPTVDMVEQLSVTSGTYAKGINEFIKGGFDEEKSIVVKPPRIKNAPITFECKVNNIIELGTEGGSGNLVICEIVYVHFDETKVDENGNIIAEKLNPVARLGYNNYVRFTREDIFETPKPLRHFGVGVDSIPLWLKENELLTGNELGKLASISALPDKNEIYEHIELSNTLTKDKSQTIMSIKQYLSANKILQAWLIILNME